MEEISIPLGLRIINLEKDMTNINPSIADSQQGHPEAQEEKGISVEMSEHRTVDKSTDRATEFPKVNEKENAPEEGEPN